MTKYLLVNAEKYNLGLVYWKYNPKKLDNDKDDNKVDMKSLEVKSIKSMISKIKQYNISNKQYNLFEILADKEYCKLYFDIDGIELNETDFKNQLLEFYNEVEKIINKKVNRKKILVYVKRDLNDNIRSSHIIFSEYKLKYFLSHYLSDKLYNSKFNDITNNIDSRVYHRFRQLCLPYNTKPYNKKVLDWGAETPQQSSQFRFMDFNIHKPHYTDKQTINIDKYVVSYTDGLMELTTEDFKIEYEEIEEVEEEYRKSVFNDKDFSELKNERDKILLNENNKNMIINELLEYLDLEFYECKSCRDWILLLKQLKVLNLDISEIKYFLFKSAEYGNVDKYTYDNNWKKYNELDISDCKINPYKIICNILNKYNITYYYHTSYLSVNLNDLCEYIRKYSGISKSEISEKLNGYLNNDLEEEIELINFNEKVSYNLKNGFLYVEDKIYNYNVEVDYKKHNEKNNVEYENIYNCDTIDSGVVDSLVYRFKTGKDKYLSVNAKWGTGKSKYIVKPILQYIFNRSEEWIKYNNDLTEMINDIDIDGDIRNYNIWRNYELDFRNRIVMISPTNSLNKKEYTELKEIPNNNFYNHIEINKIFSEKNYKKFNKIVKTGSILTSLESLDKCVDIYEDFDKTEICEKIDLLILDEFESIFNHYESNTMNKHKIKKDGKYVNKTAYTSYKSFVDIIKNSKQILILDADISNERLEWIENILKK